MTSSIQTSTGSVSYEDAMTAIRDQLTADGLTEAQIQDILDNPEDSLAVTDNPALQAYFQLCYMQLAEILDPELINSLAADVGSVDFQTFYDNADPSFNEMITALIQEDPELMALYATEAGGQSEGDYVLTLLSQLSAEAATATETDTDTDDDSEEKITDDARALQETFGLGEGFTWITEQEDIYNAGLESIANQLAEYDQSMQDLLEQFDNGEINETTYNSELSSMNAGREALLVLMQQISEYKMNFFEMISKLYDSVKDTQMAILNNQRV